MPRMDGDMQSFNIGRGGFAFTGARFEKLDGASLYTLVTIAVDVTGSVYGFKKELRNMLVTAIEACKKCGLSENILVRVLFFSDKYANGVLEVHGFIKLSDVDTSAYPDLEPGGMTPLCDACYSAIGATTTYAVNELATHDFGANGIAILVTDGGENASVATMTMVKKAQEEAITSEQLESFISILIGVNTDDCDTLLETFRQQAGITHYKPAGEATPQNLAKLAAFVSQSVSSQAQALGTGGPSQSIPATI